VNLSDGRTYEIVKERNGYIIKQQLSEGVTEYIEPMKSRKYYSSYSQAFKRLNLVARELNDIHENKMGTALFEGDKKYILKKGETSKISEPSGDELEEQAPPAPAPAPAPPAPAPAPPAPAPMPPAPAPEEGGENMGSEDMGSEDMDTENEEEKPDEEITFKTIQKLTGKLAQKIRDFDSQAGEEEEGMDANDIKYVINSILSALDLDALEEDDKDEIISRIEGEEEGEEMSSEEGGDMEGEVPSSPEDDMEGAIPPSPEGEMGEGTEVREKLPPPPSAYFKKEVDEMMSMKDALMSKIPSVYGSNVGKKVGFTEDEDEFEMDDFEDFDDMSIDVCSHCEGLGMDDLSGEECEWCGGTGEEGATHRKNRGARKHFTHGTFSESTIDKIITKYFDVEENDKKLNESKNIKSPTSYIKEMKSEISRLSESISQERAAIKFFEKNKKSELVGKTNKNNLVFRLNNENYKVSPKGRIL
jgi:hypothetical protein